MPGIDLTPTEVVVRFIGGPYDGQERPGTTIEDPGLPGGFPPSWGISYGGAEGQVVRVIYQLAQIEEYPSGMLRLTYVAPPV